jgi:hypothetical protein
VAKNSERCFGPAFRRAYRRAIRFLTNGSKTHQVVTWIVATGVLMEEGILREVRITLKDGTQTVVEPPPKGSLIPESRPMRLM